MKAGAKQSVKRKPGRPGKGGRSYTVRLSDETAEALRKIGEGNLTLGIERAARSKLRRLRGIA